VGLTDRHRTRVWTENAWLSSSEPAARQRDVASIGSFCIALQSGVSRNWFLLAAASQKSKTCGEHHLCASTRENIMSDRNAELVWPRIKVQTIILRKVNNTTPLHPARLTWLVSIDQPCLLIELTPTKPCQITTSTYHWAKLPETELSTFSKPHD